jgi:hypothetical protein
MDIATSVTIIRLGYRARCTEAGCRNLGRVIQRHADVGGAPMTSDEFSTAARALSASGPRAAHNYENGIPSIRGAICSALPKSFSEIFELLVGLNLPIGTPEISIDFCGLGLRGAAPRARDHERTRARDVRRSIYGSTTRKKIVKPTRAKWHKIFRRCPSFTTRTGAVCTAEPSFSQSSSREMALSGLSSLSRISRPVRDSWSDGALMDSSPASRVLKRRRGGVRGRSNGKGRPS